jgi:two-component system sensor histidine kinase KdpD
MKIIQDMIPSPSMRKLLREYIVSTSVVLVVSVVSYRFTDLVGYQTVSLFLLFSVALLSLAVSVGPVVLAAALSALIWNYFFIPPHFTFAIGSPQDALLFVAYFVIAAITGILTTRVRLREQNARSLYSMTKDIIHAKTLDDVAIVAVKNIRTVFECDVLLFFSSIDGELHSEPHEASTLPTDKKEFSVASWVYWNEKKAGRNSPTRFPSSTAHIIPSPDRGIPRRDRSPPRRPRRSCILQESFFRTLSNRSLRH